CRDVLEEPLAVRGELVVEQKIRGTILGIVVGNGISILILALKVDIGAEVKIEAPVAIIIGGRHSGKSPLRAGGKSKRIGLVPKGAIAQVEEQQRAVDGGHDQILASQVPEVQEQSASRVVQDTYAAALGDVFHRSIAAVLVQAVRQTAGLANID